jgi:hypothetical protein
MDVDQDQVQAEQAEQPDQTVEDAPAASPEIEMVEEQVEPVVQIVQAPAAVYPRKELQARAMEIFGVNPEVVAGALCGNKKTELTTGEVRMAIKAFLERRVHS